MEAVTASPTRTTLEEIISIADFQQQNTFFLDLFLVARLICFYQSSTTTRASP